MAATKNPNQGPPTNAPIRTKIWTQSAEISSAEWPLTERTDGDTLYAQFVAQAKSGVGISSVEQTVNQGRGRLLVTYAPDSTDGGGSAGIQLTEELYAVDLIKDIRTAPYFDDLTDEQIAFVGRCAEDRLTDEEIDAAVAESGLSSSLEKASWTALMDELYYHIIHGVDSYFETGFIVRRTRSGVTSSSINATFTGINTVVAAPNLSSQMNNLIATLPDGEWLKRPPAVEYLGKGRWRVDEEWHYAEKWSKVYGGTWGAPA